MFTRFLLSLPALIGQFFKFAFIVAVIGSMAFAFGQLLPRKNFDYRRYPYASRAWEKDGLAYQRIHIQRWKDKVPDMSQYVKSAVRKKITVFRSAEYIETLILETCVAEFVHWVLILVSPLFLIFMDSPGNWGWTALYAACNVPFILIQRYNRPRLVGLLDRQQPRQSEGYGCQISN